MSYLPPLFGANNQQLALGIHRITAQLSMGQYEVGDTLYGTDCNSLGRIAGNTAATKKFLSQTGTGTASAAPVWETIEAADVVDFNEAARDAVGGILTNSTTVTFTYNDGAPSITATVADASTSAKGVVELATDAEVENGTDTARAITPSNLGGAWTGYTPTLIAGSGTPTTTSASGRYKKRGKTVEITVTVTIANAGTAGSYMAISIPSGTAAANFSLAGTCRGLSSDALSVQLDSGNNNIVVRRYNGTTIWASGETIVVSGSYELT